jgi:hypothetical protein
MIPEMTPGLAHERARMLAADVIDVELEPHEAEWLEGHLSACLDCRAVADDYREIHAELRSLAMPEPPRDLWARTAAALDAADASSRKRAPGRTRGSQPGRPSSSRPLIGTAVAVGLVLVVTAVSVMSQSPIVRPVSPTTGPGVIAAATSATSPASAKPVSPLAVVDGTSYWMSSSGGVYQINGGATQCTAGSGGCTVASGTSQTLGSISSDSAVSAAIAPDAKQAAVWTDDKIAIMTLGAQSQTVALDLLTAPPTAPATPKPTPTLTAPPTPTPTAPATPSTSAETAPTATAPAITPDLASIAPTVAPTLAITPEPATSKAPLASGSVAILTGYQIVGRDPEFSADGTMVAFAARPVDHSTGPDVFIWRSGQDRARPVTFRHAGLFAGWFGGQVLVSEISSPRASAGATPPAASPSEAPSPTPAGAADTFGVASYLFDPTTGIALAINRPMLLPAVDPTGRFLVYWTGTVQFDPVSGLWQPGNGDLYFDSWSDLTLTPASLGDESEANPTPSAVATSSPPLAPSASPALGEKATAGPSAPPRLPATTEPSPVLTDKATDSPPIETQTPAPTVQPQLLPVASGAGAVFDWIVRWDRSGQFVAIWAADPSSLSIGRLTLFSIDGGSGRLNVNEPRLGAEKVLSTIAFDNSTLVYVSAVDGKTYMQTVPAVPPSNASTPIPTRPGQLPSGASPAVPSAPASDRPGS